jgi:protection-of-telomeres protein 1
MDSTPDPFQGEVPLPTGFSTIEKIQHLPSNLIKAGTMINVIGFVKDFQAPLRTKGTGTFCARVSDI